MGLLDGLLGGLMGGGMGDPRQRSGGLGGIGTAAIIGFVVGIAINLVYRLTSN